MGAQRSICRTYAASGLQGPLVRQNPAAAVAALGVVAILVVVIAMRLV